MMFAAFPIHDDVRSEFVSSEFCVRRLRAEQKPNYFVHVARLLPESNMEQGRRGGNECDVSLYFLLQLCHRNELI